MNKKGFTLVEILAVIVILSLVITITATKGFGAFDNTKNKITEQNKKAIEEAAKVFLTDVLNCDDDLEDYNELCEVAGLGSDCNSCDKVKNYYTQGGIISFESLKNKNYIEGNDLSDESIYNNGNIEIKGLIDNSKIIVELEIENENKLSNEEKNTLVYKIKHNDNIKINKDSPDFSKIETTEKGMYLTTDNDGFTYYFRGKQSYNYVSFAGLTWRIVRINGDGSIRMILNSTVKQGAYNTFDDVIASISYVYGDNTSNDASVALTKDNPSNAKQLVNAWYNSNIKKYDDYVQESTFCNDINYVNDSQYDSYQDLINYEFYYSFGAEQRLEPTIPIPTLKCNENSSLKLKAGLINADEVVFAGGSTKTNNSSYYLYSTIDYWTMSPKVYSKGSYASFAGTDISLNVYRVTSGKLWMTASSGNSFIKPVINLRKDVLVSEGDGTRSKPYKIKIN